MSEAAELKTLFANYYMPDDPPGQMHEEFKRRISLVCTPFHGGDLEVDGWVICAMGSPPKGTMIIFGGGSRTIVAYHIYGNSRRIDLASEMGILQAFYQKHLHGKTEPTTIPQLTTASA